MNPWPILAPFFIAAAVLFVLSRLVLSEGDPTRPPRTLPDGGLEFAFPARAFLGIYLFLGFLGLVTVSGIVSSTRSLMGIVVTVFCVGFIVLLLRVLPGTLVVTAQGLEQRYWLRKPRVIAWADVRRIEVREKQREVVIRGVGGTKIQHSKQFPDREQLMAALEAHCPDRMPGAARVIPPAVPPPEVPTA